MSYIDNAFIIYNSLANIDFNIDEFSVYFSRTFLKDKKSITAYKKLKSEFLDSSKDLLFQKLNFSDSIHHTVNSILNYERLGESITNQMIYFLFWIWHNNVEISEKKLELITRPIYLGSIGYMILDRFTDKKIFGKEYIFLSSEIIRIAEELFGQAFKNVDTRRIFNKNFSKFAEIEYLEKINRWKNCPFDWENCWHIGYKASPSFSIYEILFIDLGLNGNKINDVILGLTYMSAGIQLMDDLADAKEDLENGIETLIMKGFYSKHGSIIDISQKMVKEYLTDERIENIYSKGNELFDMSNKLFEKHNDEILILYNEIQRYRFNEIFEFVETS